MPFQPTHRVFELVLNGSPNKFCFLDLNETDSMSDEEVLSFLKRIDPKYENLIYAIRRGRYED